jgi:hypothetical protein
MMESGWAMGGVPCKAKAGTMPGAKPHCNLAGLGRKFAMAMCFPDVVSQGEL